MKIIMVLVAKIVECATKIGVELVTELPVLSANQKQREIGKPKIIVEFAMEVIPELVTNTVSIWSLNYYLILLLKLVCKLVIPLSFKIIPKKTNSCSFLRNKW